MVPQWIQWAGHWCWGDPLVWFVMDLVLPGRSLSKCCFLTNRKWNWVVSHGDRCSRVVNLHPGVFSSVHIWFHCLVLIQDHLERPIEVSRELMGEVASKPGWCQGFMMGSWSVSGRGYVLFSICSSSSSLCSKSCSPARPPSPSFFSAFREQDWVTHNHACTNTHTLSHTHILNWPVFLGPRNTSDWLPGLLLQLKELWFFMTLVTTSLCWLKSHDQQDGYVKSEISHDSWDLMILITYDKTDPRSALRLFIYI